MKILVDVAPVTAEMRQAIEDCWVRILRAELEARAQAAAVAPAQPNTSAPRGPDAAA